MIIPRAKQYDSAATSGHYKGRFVKTPDVKLDESTITRKYEKQLNAKSPTSFDITITERIYDITPLKIEVAKKLSNPTIEQNGNKLIITSSDDNKIITIKTKNPEKVLEAILLKSL